MFLSGLKYNSYWKVDNEVLTHTRDYTTEFPAKLKICRVCMMRDIANRCFIMNTTGDIISAYPEETAF